MSPKGVVIACAKCHRLRTLVGMHLCVPARLTQPRATSKHPRGGADPTLSVPSEIPRPISTIMLPGTGPAATVWNALVEGRCRR